MAAPRLVIVSVCNDAKGARRRLLDARLPETAERHQPGCGCGFDWGMASSNTTQLALAILADHFEHNPCDLPRAKDLASCAVVPNATEAAKLLCLDFAARVIAPIPAPALCWSMTTMNVREYLDHAAGVRANPPSPLFCSIEPGEGARSARAETILRELRGGDENTHAAMSKFVEAMQGGRLQPLPTMAAEAILSAFVESIGHAVRHGQNLAPYLSAQVGPVQFAFELLTSEGFAKIERVFGASRARAAFITAQETFGIKALRQVFGGWLASK